jgi:Mycobacterial methylenetetrahydrofolate reductase
MRRSFAEALAERPLFFEPLPPSARLSPDRVNAHVDEVVRLLASVPRLDAVDIPELVDENHDGRPYYRSQNPPEFARTVGERTGCAVVVNKVVAHLPSADALAAWTRTTIGHGVRNFVLVGGSSRYIPYPGPAVTEANRICHPLVAEAGGRLGNIAIPQRTGEAHRMLAKTRSGASFFTTQILFDSDAVLRMVQEYGRLCTQAGLAPATVLLSVAPLADDGDAQFIRWLGADIPEAAERTILNGDDAGASARSVVQALRLWKEVRHGVERSKIGVPIGVNVEQITQRHLATAAAMLTEFAPRLDDRDAP